MLTISDTTKITNPPCSVTTEMFGRLPSLFPQYSLSRCPISTLTQSPEPFIRRSSTTEPWLAISHVKVWTQQRLFKGYGQVNKTLFWDLLHRWSYWCKTRCAAAVCLCSCPGAHCPWQLNQSYWLISHCIL